MWSPEQGLKVKSAVRVALKYVVFSSLWILTSDTAIAAVSSSLSQLRSYSILKGLAFVLITGALLFYWVRKELQEKTAIIAQLNREAEIREQLLKELHHRVKNNLQVVIGLINTTIGDREGLDDLRHQINNKLHALTSVVNIVYNRRDFQSIGLREVLDEYAQVCRWNIRVTAEQVTVNLNIERMTSILLVLNAILEALPAGADHPNAELRIADEHRIVLTAAGLDAESFRCISNDEIVVAMLDSFRGKLEFRDQELSLSFP